MNSIRPPCLDNFWCCINIWHCSKTLKPEFPPTCKDHCCSHIGFGPCLNTRCWCHLDPPHKYLQRWSWANMSGMLALRRKPSLRSRARREDVATFAHPVPKRLAGTCTLTFMKKWNWRLMVSAELQGNLRCVFAYCYDDSASVTNHECNCYRSRQTTFCVTYHWMEKCKALKHRLCAKQHLAWASLHANCQ